MTQREEFEVFFVKGFGGEFTVSKKTMLLYDENTDQYMNGFVNDSYKTWKAAKAHAVPQWIPVGERLPDNKLSMWSDTVIAVSDIGDVFALSFMDGYWQRTSAFINSGSTEIIGWMPIPELPAAQEQNK